jgi:hypothetical protein
MKRFRASTSCRNLIGGFGPVAVPKLAGAVVLQHTLMLSHRFLVADIACFISTACRNLIGGFGPVAVAKLAEVVGLQHAMLLAPACYIGSGLIFLIAEREIEQQQQQAALQQQ